MAQVELKIGKEKTRLKKVANGIKDTNKQILDLDKKLQGKWTAHPLLCCMG